MEVDWGYQDVCTVRSGLPDMSLFVALCILITSPYGKVVGVISFSLKTGIQKCRLPLALSPLVTYTGSLSSVHWQVADAGVVLSIV